MNMMKQNKQMVVAMKDNNAGRVSSVVIMHRNLYI
jgi:hypothetical protein